MRYNSHCQPCAYPSDVHVHGIITLHSIEILKNCIIEHTYMEGDISTIIIYYDYYELFLKPMKNWLYEVFLNFWR